MERLFHLQNFKTLEVLKVRKGLSSSKFHGFFSWPKTYIPLSELYTPCKNQGSKSC